MTFSAAVTSFEPMQTWLPPWGLSGCVRAVLGRHLASASLPDAQRWSYYPATPTCSINCLFDGGAEITEPGQFANSDAARQRLPALTVTGPQSHPRSLFYTGPAQGVMVILYPDAWLSLTGMSASLLNDQVLDARELMPPALLALCQGLQAPGSAEARVQRFLNGLQTLWQSTPRSSDAAALAPEWGQAMSPWMSALALRAAGTGWGRSLRQSERRIKQWTGWSLRQLQGAVRGEATFLAVVEALVDDRLNWTQIALDNGFSDQSHFIRETRRLTGFSPQALRQGYLNDESFWAYRAWAQLAGYPVPKHGATGTAS